MLMVIAEKLLKTSEVADRLNVNRVTITKWIKAGRVRAIRVGKLWRIPMSEVDRILREGLR